ncbi:MAG: hypothetical protein AB1746_04540 [Candidatus Zixiibacteriota bacterium]
MGKPIMGDNEMLFRHDSDIRVLDSAVMHSEGVRVTDLIIDWLLSGQKSSNRSALFNEIQEFFKSLLDDQLQIQEPHVKYYILSKIDLYKGLCLIYGETKDISQSESSGESPISRTKQARDKLAQQISKNPGLIADAIDKTLSLIQQDYENDSIAKAFCEFKGIVGFVRQLRAGHQDHANQNEAIKVVANIIKKCTAAEFGITVDDLYPQLARLAEHNSIAQICIDLARFPLDANLLDNINLHFGIVIDAVKHATAMTKSEYFNKKYSKSAEQVNTSSTLFDCSNSPDNFPEESARAVGDIIQDETSTGDQDKAGLDRHVADVCDAFKNGYIDENSSENNNYEEQSHANTESQESSQENKNAIESVAILRDFILTSHRPGTKSHTQAVSVFEPNDIPTLEEDSEQKNAFRVRLNRDKNKIKKVFDYDPNTHKVSRRDSNSDE